MRMSSPCHDVHMLLQNVTVPNFLHPSPSVYCNGSDEIRVAQCESTSHVHCHLTNVIRLFVGSTYNMESGDWTAAAAAAAVAADSPNPDILLSPHCSEEELTMLLEALSQPSDVAAASGNPLPPAPAAGLMPEKSHLEKSPLGREAALSAPVMG